MSQANFQRVLGRLVTDRDFRVRLRQRRRRSAPRPFGDRAPAAHGHRRGARPRAHGPADQFLPAGQADHPAAADARAARPGALCPRGGGLLRQGAARQLLPGRRGAGVLRPPADRVPASLPGGGHGLRTGDDRAQATTARRRPAAEPARRVRARSGGAAAAAGPRRATACPAATAPRRHRLFGRRGSGRLAYRRRGRDRSGPIEPAIWSQRAAISSTEAGVGPKSTAWLRSIRGVGKAPSRRGKQRTPMRDTLRTPARPRRGATSSGRSSGALRRRTRVAATGEIALLRTPASLNSAAKPTMRPTCAIFVVE